MRVRIEETLLPGLPVCSGVPQGSVLGALLFLIYINNLSAFITSRCYLFSDDVKLIDLSNDMVTVLEDLRQTVIWADSWGMKLNVAQYQHLYLGPGLAPYLNMPNNTDGLSPLVG